MDDKDKGIVEKTIEAVEEFASEIKEAAKHMMEPEPLQPGDELVMLPIEDSGVLGVPMLPQLNKKKANKSRPKTEAAINRSDDIDSQNPFDLRRLAPSRR
jgi:hypothetical protein